MSDSSFRPPAPPLRFTLETIAHLSSGQIYSLAKEELIALIRAVPYPFAGKERLEFFDRDTLERVAHLVRRWCQNKLALQVAESVGQAVPDTGVPGADSHASTQAAEHAQRAAVSATA